MKRLNLGLKCLILCMLFMDGSFAYAENAMVAHVSKSASDFQISLPTNPTTGYQLRLTQFDHARFKVLNSTYIPPQSKLMGAGGTMVFTFQRQANKTYPQQAVFLFRYAQPWNPSSATITHVTVLFE